MQTFVQRVKPIHFFFLTGLKAGISSVYEQESQTGSLFRYPEKKKKSDTHCARPGHMDQGYLRLI